MNIFKDEIEAFLEVCRHRHFTKAAQAMHITQPALSQRISKLEGDLDFSLFIRNAGRVDLTHQAEILLRELQSLKIKEAELFQALGKQDQNQLQLRIGGFSSITRSILIPSLASFIRQNENIQFQWFVREIRELTPMLRSGECDIICTNTWIDKPGVVNIELGKEELVLCKSITYKNIPEIYLDHDENDPTTLNLLKANGKTTTKLRRRFMDDVYGIYEGVKLGWGYGVLPKHMITKNIEALNLKSIKTPVILQYYESLGSNKSVRDLVRLLQETCSKVLS